MGINLAPILNRALSYRSIGPYRGGRVVAVAGHSAAPQLYYFGSTGGGVWKTEDGGITWGNSRTDSSSGPPSVRWPWQRPIPT